MKIALIIGGDLRTFADCFPSLENNILNYNRCDVFLHLYNEPLAEDAVRLLRPTKYIIEDKTSVIHDIHAQCHINKPPETDPAGVFYQWRTVKMSFDLIGDGDYDMILKTRYDVKYTTPLRLENYDGTKLNVPIGGDWRGGLFDMLAWSSKKVMSRYCSLYERINEYVVGGVPCHSELLNLYNNKDTEVSRCEYTVLLRREFDRGFVEDRVFTLR
jgi:hypothetical protein